MSKNQKLLDIIATCDDEKNLLTRKLREPKKAKMPREDV